MPELPEAQIAADTLGRALIGRPLREIVVRRERMLRQTTQVVRKWLIGQTIGRVERYGKHVLAHIGRPTSANPKSWTGTMLAIHLGMSGKLVANEDERARILFRTDDRSLAFVDTRTLGRVSAGPADDVRASIRLGDLGPDARTIQDGDAFARALGGGRRPFKQRLMDQTRIAGLGNIQACEALFRAGISPLRTHLTSDEIGALLDGMHASLDHTFDQTCPDPSGDVAYMSDGAHIANPFLVYGREHKPCRRCAAHIERIKQSGRSTFWCPGCQH